jgi:hypothetical protein
VQNSKFKNKTKEIKMAKSNSKDLVKAKQYEIMTMQKDEIKDLLISNLEGEAISANDLTVIKVPSGGTTTWTIPTISGEEETKAIQGIIIFSQTTRAYWPTAYDSGAGEPPQCVSENGIKGEGDPGGNCQACPMNEFVVDDNGKKKKPCSERRMMFMVLQDEILPVIVRAPVMSLRPAKQYLIGLLSAKKKPYSVYTELTLEKAKNDANQDYSKIVFKKIGDVENLEVITSYANTMRPILMKASQEINVKRDADEA